MLRFIVSLSSILFISGCSKPADPVKSGETYGFALLYSVSSQEENVDKLLWIKNPGPETAAWVKQIAVFNKKVSTQLESWKKSGKVDNLTNDGLPLAEDDARKRATSRTTGELLFSNDVNLEVALIVAQLKALGYCADLCYAINKLSTDSEIKSTASNWQTRFTSLNNEGTKLLEAHFVDPQSAGLTEQIPAKKMDSLAPKGPPAHQ